MSKVTEILDRLPNADGGLRRRFISGLLFLLIILIGIFLFPGIPPLAQVLLDGIRATNLQWSVLNSISATIILYGVIFVVGNLIDVIADVFLYRIFSLFGRMIAFREVYAYYKSIIGREKCEMVLSKSERSSYKELPLFVQEGLRNPYKDSLR